MNSAIGKNGRDDRDGRQEADESEWPFELRVGCDAAAQIVDEPRQAELETDGNAAEPHLERPVPEAEDGHEQQQRHDHRKRGKRPQSLNQDG